MCQGKGGGGAASSIFRQRSVWLKPLHSIHIKAKSEKHIHNMATIFYLYYCTPNKISNWSLFELIFSDQAIIASKRIFAYISVFKSANV